MKQLPLFPYKFIYLITLIFLVPMSSKSSNHPWRSYDVMKIFKMGAIKSEIYFRLLFY